MSTSYSIHSVASTDLPALGELLHTAKLALPINRLLWKDWPNDAAQKPQYAQALESGFKEPSIENFKAIDNASGETVGYLGLARKQPVKQEESVQNSNPSTPPNLPDGVDTEVCTAVMKAVAEIAEDTEGMDCFELVYMCVDAPYQRQGIGSQLLQLGFQKTRKEGLPFVVCSEPAAHGFFLHHGFQDTRHVDLDLSQWAPPLSGFGMFRLSGMVWSPWLHSSPGMMYRTIT